MLVRYFFHIGFVGTNYVGWQKLPGINSVQQAIETTLSEILKNTIAIVGCGRTDAHVHASQYFFHADLELVNKDDLLFRLNKRLPGDIVVYHIIPMEGLPHARFDATERQYNYYFHTFNNPFLKQWSSLYPIKNLSVDKMKNGLNMLCKYNDYRALCKTPARNKHTICNVSDASLWVSENEDRFMVQISSNRFLGGMIRAIMFHLLEIGQGILDIDQFEKLLADKIPAPNLKLAQPQGLYLSKITYPYLDLPSQGLFKMTPLLKAE